MFVVTSKRIKFFTLVQKIILSFGMKYTSYDIHIVDIVRWLWGDMDNMMKTLITFVLFSFLSTIILNIYQHSMSKQLILKELFKFIIIFMLVSMSHLIDFHLTESRSTLQTLTIMYYIANEGIIVLENAEKIGIPLPQFLKSFLLKLRSKAEHHKD